MHLKPLHQGLRRSLPKELGAVDEATIREDGAEIVGQQRLEEGHVAPEERLYILRIEGAQGQGVGRDLGPGLPTRPQKSRDARDKDPLQAR